MNKLNLKPFLWMPAVFMVIFIFFTSCKKREEKINPEPITQPSVSVPIKDMVFEKRGENSFVYTKYKPLVNKPVTVYYYIPTTGDITKMPVLFSFHGAERSGTIQRNAWKHFAEKKSFIVIAPQFDREYFPENDYQFGGVFTSNSFNILNAKVVWTYQIVEALFDYFKAETESTATSYLMFGHSAGGQFVHRFLLAMPNARVNKAVAANPGAWTMPFVTGLIGTDKKVYGWPTSVLNTPFATKDAVSNYLEKKMWVQLGQLDIDTQESSLPKDAPAKAQGANRLERGRFFYNQCKLLAENLYVKYAFQKAEVAEANHSSQRMIYGKIVSDPTDVVNIGENSAYNLLFK